MPSIAVEGDAHQKLFSGDTGGEVGVDGVGDCIALIARACGEWSYMTGDVTPWAAEVIGHESDAVDDAADGSHVSAFVGGWVGSDGYGEE